MQRRHRGLTVAEAAAACGVSEITVRVWINRGRIRRNAHGNVDAYSLDAYTTARLKRGDPVPADAPQPATD